MRPAMFGLVARLVAVAIVTTPVTSLAQPTAAPDFAHAAEIYRAATSELAGGHYENAARGFGEAYEITKDAVLFFKIGIANEKAGKCDAALISYDRYLKEAKPSQQFVEMTNERIKACGGTVGSTAPDFARAAEIYRAASNDMAEGHYETAARGFGTAYDMTKDAVLFFKIGIAYEKAGKCDVALTSYDRYLKEAKPSQKFVEMTNERIKACSAGHRASAVVSFPSSSAEPVVIGGLGRWHDAAPTGVRAGKGPNIGQIDIEPAGGPKVETSPHRTPGAAAPRDPPVKPGPPVRPEHRL
ncbi:MAG: hypothetical protein JWO36_4527 [Myxococcales bacterium]|nr:hypothetical protein [Myxococcales bacterium]